MRLFSLPSRQIFEWLTDERHQSHILLLWLVVGLSICIQSAGPTRLTKLRSNCQTRLCWSSMNQISFTALSKMFLKIYFCVQCEKVYDRVTNFSCLKTDQTSPQLDMYLSVMSCVSLLWLVVDLYNCTQTFWSMPFNNASWKLKMIITHLQISGHARLLKIRKRILKSVFF